MLLTTVSHELRTPLNAILGFAQLLEVRGGLDEQSRGYVRSIRMSGDHMLALIGDLLDVAAIDAGQLNLAPSPVPTRYYLVDTLSILAGKATDKGVALRLDLCDDAPETITVDARRLRQVLLNLLSNALKFTDRGSVTLRVTNGHPGRLGFEVVDTGVGIAPEHLQRIFQPFEQVGDQERKREGTGLGLTISRQIVRLMGGDIHVTSDLGAGSTFRFEVAVA